MNNELVPLPNEDGCSPAVLQPSVVKPIGVWELYDALLADATKDKTRMARESDVRDLLRFLIERSILEPGAHPRAACAGLCGSGRGPANALVTAYQRWMLGRGLKPTTVNRRISTVSRIIDLANRYDVVTWALTVDGLPVESYRDTAGPGRAGWLRIYESAQREATRTHLGRRNLSIICLLYFSALRREEVVQLDLADWNAETGRLAIIGKGRYEKELVTPNGETVAALERWIEARGSDPGPLFVRLDHAAKEVQRIGGRAVWELVRVVSSAAGLKTPARPHGLRHQAATEMARRSNGNVLKIQRALRHKDPKTTQKYVDNLEDVAGEMSRLLGES
jgi:integrase/recombinase XerC